MASMALPMRFRAQKERIFEIDFLRGIAVALMVLIHACYALGYGVDQVLILPKDAPKWINESQTFFKFIFMSITQPDGAAAGGIYSSYAVKGYNLHTNLFCLEAFFAGSFMFISGISCSFSKSNFQRGIQLAYVAVLMTVFLETASFFLGTNFHIWMGIIHSIAFGLIVYSIYDYFFKDWWQHLLFLIPLIAINFFAMLRAFPNNNMIVLDPYKATNFSEWLYDVGGLLAGRCRYGDDYFSPLLVTIAIFLGGIVGKTLYRDKKSIFPASFPTKWASPILFIGKHTLIIYLLHQVIIFAIVGIVLLSMGAKIKGF